MLGNAIKKGALNSVKKLTQNREGRSQLFKMIENTSKKGRCIYIDENKDIFYHIGEVKISDDKKTVKIENEFIPCESKDKIFSVLMGEMIGKLIAASIPPEKIAYIIDQMQPNGISECLLYIAGSESKEETFFLTSYGEGLELVVYDRQKILELSEHFFSGMGDFLEKDAGTFIDEISDKMTE